MENLNTYLEIPKNYQTERFGKINKKIRDSPIIKKKEPEIPSVCDDENVLVRKDPIFIRNSKIEDPPLSLEDKLNPKNNPVILNQREFQVLTS